MHKYIYKKMRSYTLKNFLSSKYIFCHKKLKQYLQNTHSSPKVQQKVSYPDQDEACVALT